jgi:hypothetical protein
MKSRNLLPAVLFVASLSSPAVNAALISLESFSGYTNATQLDAQTAPIVTGYTGNWVHGNTSWGTGDVQSFTTGLSYSGLATSGGSAGVLAGGGQSNSGRVARALDGSLTIDASTTGTLYLSFLFQKQTGSAAYQMLELYNGINTIDTNGDASRAFQAGASGNNYAFNVGNPNPTQSLGVSDTAVHQFIVKFDLSASAGGDSTTVWLDSTTETGGIVTSGLNLAWDTLSLADYSDYAGSWDEIRFGTTFADVIPEPSAALLGSLGMLGLLRRRRA